MLNDLIIYSRCRVTRALPIAAPLIISILISLGPLQAGSESASPPLNSPPSATATPFRFDRSRSSQRAEMYYGAFWGVDSLNVKSTESGELIRFAYRVLDAAKATPLSNKKAEPFLVDPQAHVKLVVPSLEKVGQLRQSATPEAGKAYWMAFSNKGRLVKRGDRVTVIIGSFRAEGLVVE